MAPSALYASLRRCFVLGLYLKMIYVSGSFAIQLRRIRLRLGISFCIIISGGSAFVPDFFKITAGCRLCKVDLIVF